MQLSLLGILIPHLKPIAQPQQYVCLHLQTLQGLLVETDSTAECSNSKTV